MVPTILTNKAPRVNDEETYNNSVKAMPSLLLKAVTVDVNNWRENLVTSGCYKNHMLS